MAQYYVRTDGSDSNAGTADIAGGAWLTLAHAGATVAAGDTVMVRASAGNASSYPTSSLDYTISGFFTPTAGSASAGFTKWIGYNGVPTIGSPGLGFYNCTFDWWEGLYFAATGNGNGSFGVLNGSDCVIKNCTINLNNQAALVGIQLNEGEVLSSEIYGGTASPTSSSGAYGVLCGSYAVLVEGCRIHHCRDHGVLQSNASAGVHVLDSLVYANVGDGVGVTPTDTVAARVIGCTIDGNQGHGVNVSSSNGAAWAVIRNNIITNHVQSAKAGINVATSSSDGRKRAWVSNNVWNNTSNYVNVTADATDLSVDPGYANAGTGDFTPSATSLKGAAVPTAFGSVTSQSWLGAVQPAASAGGGPVGQQCC